MSPPEGLIDMISVYQEKEEKLEIQMPILLSTGNVIKPTNLKNRLGIYPICNTSVIGYLSVERILIGDSLFLRGRENPRDVFRVKEEKPRTPKEQRIKQLESLRAMEKKKSHKNRW